MLPNLARLATVRFDAPPFGGPQPGTRFQAGRNPKGSRRLNGCLTKGWHGCPAAVAALGPLWLASRGQFAICGKSNGSWQDTRFASPRPAFSPVVGENSVAGQDL